MTVNVDPSENFPYEIRSFPVRKGSDGVDPATVKWVHAVMLGFHDGAGDTAAIEKFVESEEKDGRILWGAYASRAPERGWDAEYPVATYATHRKTLNVGNGTLLPAHLITAVTVRGTHRRRGILRKVIGTDLRQAQADGVAVAALTASEATIYGRFGFGPATHYRSIQVDSGPKFSLKGSTKSGMVDIADPQVLKDLEPELFEQLHATTFGSIGRQDAYRYLASGAWTYDHPEPDKNVRAAVHYGADGVLDGYVAYKFTGWDKTPATVAVRDLLATTPQAYLALWGYLGSIDLVERVSWKRAPMDDPLEWALTDKRGYEVKGVEDHLWLRILDVAAALGARYYWTDGSITLKVNDPLSLAQGVYRLDVAKGSGTVTGLEEPAQAELELGIAELSSLYLAGIPAQILAAAGTITERRVGAAAEFDRLFGTPLPPRCRTDF
ncbi:GNAT family N-acetyltransferase [Paenarthrobacter sp. Z7-10]|uniref:GNAT family N-acetyltransferase n=1 Tax=Paenarthrobacter sp. Z7-10 TaxID=2787635 RepID=UPI0022A9109F|nr:GNAT family N-acetyltransferase [Paenarthrobacter sp. Z7-10]